MSNTRVERKVTAGALAGAVTVIGGWALREFGGIDLPAEVASAVTTILTFATSWLVPNA